MARLSSLVGGILAELARARAIADELTKELVEDYEKDPVLASMSVPRITMKEIGLTLRFTVDDVEEVPPAEPDPAAIRKEWPASFSRRIDRVVERLAGGADKLTEEERKQLKAVLARTASGQIPTQLLKEAVAGRVDRVAGAVAKPALDKWATLPPTLRKRLGNKAAFTKALTDVVARDLDGYLKKKRSRAFMEAALASSVKVAVQRDQLPSDPAQQQEIHLTLSGEDLEIVLDDRNRGDE